MAAFDAEAAAYDRSFGGNLVGRLFRAEFQARLAALFSPGTVVLDVGCGTGEDALFLARRGVHVLGLDPAPGMLACARAKAQAAGQGPERLRFEVAAAETVGALSAAVFGGATHRPAFDGAYSDFGALNCVDLERFGAGLAAVLRPGAAVLFNLMGRYPLPALLAHAWRAAGRPRESVPRVAGIPVPTAYPSPREFRRRLGAPFAWHTTRALGVLVPDPHYAVHLERHPRLLAGLARLERRVGRWPVLRSLGDHLVFEGRRR